MLPHWDFWPEARKSLMDYALAISYAAGVGFAITPILPASGTGASSPPRRPKDAWAQRFPRGGVMPTPKRVGIGGGSQAAKFQKIMPPHPAGAKT